jgi:GNAT superfamily N-acetyltransferase
MGAVDTPAFEKRLEAEWWPPLRARYCDPQTPTTRDERMMHLIHHPPRTPRRIADKYPAHLHIDLLPRVQGKGWGKRMVDHWLHVVRGRGTHLAVGESNARAVKFYRAYGFAEIERIGAPHNVIFFGIG